MEATVCTPACHRYLVTASASAWSHHHRMCNYSNNTLHGARSWSLRE